MTDTDRGNGQGDNAARPATSEELGERLRLHAAPPQVARLSRKALAGASAVVLVFICGAAFWALQGRRSQSPAPEELYSTDHHNVADEVTTLPKDYAALPKDVPRLGPPLPGDLGRPIVAAQGSSSSSTLGLDAEQQRVNQESEAARISKVFASTNVRPPAAVTSPGEAPSTASSSSDEAFAQNAQDRKLAFVNGPVDKRTTSSDRLVKPASPFVVQAGTVIPAALITESAPICQARSRRR